MTAKKAIVEDSKKVIAEMIEEAMSELMAEMVEEGRELASRFAEIEKDIDLIKSAIGAANVGNNESLNAAYVNDRVDRLKNYVDVVRDVNNERWEKIEKVARRYGVA